MTTFKKHSTTLSRRSGVALVIGLAAAQLAPACNDRTTHVEACYPEDRDWGNDGPPLYTPLGYCQWSNEDLQRTEDGHIVGIPDAPPNVALRHVKYCVDVEDGQVCDACPAEETDALLRKHFATLCEEEITYFKRGCYYLLDGEGLAEYEQQIIDDNLEVDHETGRPRCCYKALIAPTCLEDSHGGD